MRSFLGVPVLVGREPFGNLYLTEKQGAAEFSAEDEEAVVVLAEFAGVAIDHARRYTGSERRCAELQGTVDALEATIEIARALGGQTDLATILELVAKRGRALVRRTALVIELERDGSSSSPRAPETLPQGLVGRRIASRTRSPAQRCAPASQRPRQAHTAPASTMHGLGQFGAAPDERPGRSVDLPR